jgi:RNase adaptor protein for sRNA GlmZ degradation
MLKIQVYSFSYIQGQIPADNSGNGGGFVFDCRALPNPGRFDAYKSLTGMDEPVIAYLEKEAEVSEFLSHVYSLVDQSVEKYLSRGFTNLMVSFGCTGGQHRSVYSAEELAIHLAQKFDDVIISVRHLAREKATN